jgi:hypothetical protein
MNRTAGLCLVVVAVFLVPVRIVLAEPFDGMSVQVSRGTGESVMLDWTGGQPAFTVHRSTDPASVLGSASVIGTTDVRSFGDTPPAGVIFFYEITSPCVYNPPEVCNGVDDDCDGTVDGPGSETSCALPNATAQCAGGVCIVAACSAGFGDCNGTATDGCETNTHLAQSTSPATLWANDPNPNKDLMPGYSRVTAIANCGGCGVTCDDGVACSTDLCVPTDQAGSAVGVCRHFDRGQCSEARCGGVPLPAGTPPPGDPACTAPDGDGDGLNDPWETAQTNPYSGANQPVGVDLNCDGEISDADGDLIWHEAPSGPSIPDIYVQFDYMAASMVPGQEEAETHAPLPAAVDAVTAAFTGRGVTLHIDPVHHLLPHSQVVYFPSFPPDPCAAGDAVDFYALKAAHFDPRRQIGYHYLVFGHDSCYAGSAESGASGMSEILGNDGMVTLGSFTYDGTVAQIEEKKKREQAGTFLHELGHNLKLHHGGPDDSSCVPSPCPGIDLIKKPNYFSSMNYLYQLGGILRAQTAGTIVPLDPTVPWRVDFSSDPLVPLIESSLDENVGLNGAPPPRDRDIANYVCFGTDPYLAPGQGPVDWNCDGTIGPSVVADINGDGETTPLPGANDWDHLAYQFQCSSTYADGVPAAANVTTGELSLAQATAQHLRADLCQVNTAYPGTGTLGECNQLNDDYVAVLEVASQCDSSSPSLQCNQIVDNSLICPCPTEVNPSNTCAFETMANLKRQWDVWRCDLWYSCPIDICPQPTSGVCQGAPGRCLNVF